MPILTINGKVLKSSSGKILSAPSKYSITVVYDYVDTGLPIDKLASVYQCEEIFTGSDIPDEEWTVVYPYASSSKVLRATGPSDIKSKKYLISKPFIRVALTDDALAAGWTIGNSLEDHYCTPWTGPVTYSAGIIYKIPQYADEDGEKKYPLPVRITLQI